MLRLSVSCIVVAILGYGMMSMYWCCRLSFESGCWIICHHVAIYYHVSDLGSFSLLDRSSLRSSSRYLAEIFVEIFLAMTTGWDDRGNPGDRHTDEGTKLWIGNLREDLTPEALTAWLTAQHIQLERPVKLVPWRLKRAEETISFTECPYPHPTVTPTLAVRSVWTCSRNCRDTRVTGVMMAEEMISDTECPHPHSPPPSPQIFLNLLWLNMFGKNVA